MQIWNLTLEYEKKNIFKQERKFIKTFYLKQYFVYLILKDSIFSQIKKGKDDKVQKYVIFLIH